MQLIPARFAPGLAAIVVAACASMAVATVVDAQTTPPTGGGMPHPGGPHGDGMGGPGMHMMREAARLKTSLQLNAQQAALWDRAVAGMKPQGDPRQEMKAHHERLAAMLDDPNFDPRRMAAETDREMSEREARMKSMREPWFAFYDSLTPVQRGQVREFLRERMLRGGHRMHEGRGGYEHMHGPLGDAHRDGIAPPVPPAAPASPAPAR